ncbi:hypothetical protein AN414_22940 [Serratia marcescens]|nr:hypothetical protein AN414_22940 [Serratia marcescens]
MTSTFECSKNGGITLDIEVIQFLRLLKVGHALNGNGIPWIAVPLSEHLLYKSLFVSYELICAKHPTGW